MTKKPIYLLLFVSVCLLHANTLLAYTHADTLRGSNGRGRDWWDVIKYDLSVEFDADARSIEGRNKITFRITGSPTDSMQIDLQEPMAITSVSFYSFGRLPEKLKVEKEGNVWWVKYPFSTLKRDTDYTLEVAYHGVPRAAINPPWDGGFSWKTDDNGHPWVSVSCQGLGASVWWPCKDAQWEEPDSGMNIGLKLTGKLKDLKAISNGKYNDTWTLRLVEPDTSIYGYSWFWKVKNPINNYDATFYIGDYTHWHDTLMGENGILNLDYWVLSYNGEKARKQFAVVKQMLHCYEYWLGPYPFYEDGYKLVESPYLGMEHQSAVAYGNKYQMGYLGSDRSGTGIGMNFDYIIVHESAHEWFGNNVTARDIADNWVHEGITTFSESLFTECLLGKEKGMAFCRGEWGNIRNDKPIIGDYGVNQEGSNDMYDKGAAIMYMIRQMTGDDEKFRQMLRGLGREFYHKCVTTAQVEDYISTATGLDLKAFFNQYLRTANLPQLEYYLKKGKLHYRFSNVVAGFSLPVAVTSSKTTVIINPTGEWQEAKWKRGYNLNFSKNFLFSVKG